MEHAIPSKMYDEIGKDLINEMPELAYIKVSECRIAYLVSDQCKKEGKVKPCYAEAEIIPEKFKWGINVDFAITVYGPNVALFSKEQLRILIFQQLLKLVIEYNDISGAEKYSIREYDVTDFEIIIQKYGTDWMESQGSLFEDLVDEDQE